MSNIIEHGGSFYRRLGPGEMLKGSDRVSGSPTRITGHIFAEHLAGSQAKEKPYFFRETPAPEIKPATPAPIYDGGPAFARTGHECTNGDWVVPQNGMTLRDWFAGQALQGRAHRLNSPFDHRDILASDCYAIADAMLEARKEASE
jgi:hypothetical protein